MNAKVANQNYNRRLEICNFNDAQIDLIIKCVDNYQVQKKGEWFDEDTYEREMWYTMNQSGLFENEPENVSGFTNWGIGHTRRYITEIHRSFLA